MLNIEQHDELVVYLRRRELVDPSETPVCRTLAGGVSCRTVLVELGDDGDNLVLKQALEFLRVAEVWPGDPTRVEREAEAMRVLGELLAPHQVPGLVFEDRDEHVIAMTAVPEPHQNWKEVLLEGGLAEREVVDFGSILGAIHGGAFQRRGELAERFVDRSQFDTLRVDPYYRFAARAAPVAAPFLFELINDTAAVAETLVHGDFSPKNVLVRPTGCVLLDHEVAHWGDPAFDIGFATAHFLGKANHLSGQRGDFADAARLFWDTYREAVADVPWFEAAADRVVRHSLACTLARVVGKSQLEYLSEAERGRQAEAVRLLLADPPADYHRMVTDFVAELEALEP